MPYQAQPHADSCFNAKNLAPPLQVARRGAADRALSDEYRAMIQEQMCTSSRGHRAVFHLNRADESLHLQSARITFR